MLIMVVVAYRFCMLEKNSSPCREANLRWSHEPTVTTSPFFANLTGICTIRTMSPEVLLVSRSTESG